MDSLTQLLARYGLTVVFVNVLAEQLGAPVPAVPTLIVAGALAADGSLSGWLALLLAIVGSLIGDVVWFYLGRVRGRKILTLLCRISVSPDSCVRQTDRLFEEWGVSSLVFAKFVPGLSTVAPPLAGASGIRLGRFLWFSFLGALLWAGSSILAGFVFHDAIDRLLAVLADLGHRALVVLAAALAVYVVFKWWKRHRFFKALRVARISAEELDRLMREGPPPLVVDVRTPGGRAQDPRRIPGAIALDMETLDEHLEDLPTERAIVLYCT